MFESDDWDLDQDFLNDVDDKSIRLHSITDENEREPKRRKVEISNDSILSSNNEVDLCKKKNFYNAKTCDEDKVSRKNLILGMFNKSPTNKIITQSVLSNSKMLNENNLLKQQSDQTQSFGNNQLSRKDLVHGILKNKNIDDKVIKNNTKNLESQKIETNIKINNNSNVQQQKSILPNSKIKYEIPKKSLQEKSCSNTDNIKHMTSRKQLLCNILKQRSVDKVEFKTKSVIKPPQVQSNKKMTLIRRFPGPAGLLPDDIDANVSHISYLNSLEENESTVESSDSNLPEYCSQNTKDLFTEGAWQLMLDDLPDSFLKGYEIATVKQMASANGYNSTKIDFLAGIVERIDHSHDNPPIVLKDFTDSIQGIVHRDIPLKYPGLLETNVVVLLCDVGLLKTSESFISNKYQVLISPSSLLAIYSNKGKIERTHYMELVLKHISNGEEEEEEEDEIDHVLTKALEEESLKTSCKDFNTKSLNCNTNVNKTFENMNKSMNFDLVEDISFTVSSNKITNSQNKNFISALSKDAKYINKKNKELVTNKIGNMENGCQQKSDTLVQTLKKFSPNTNTRKMLSHNSTILQTHVDHPSSIQMCSEVEKMEMSEKMDVDKSNVNMVQETESVDKKVYTPCNDNPENCVQFLNTMKRNKLSVRSKLLQFKNINTLTQSQNSETNSPSDLKNDKETFHNHKLSHIPNSSSNTSLYNNTENDSDDEMLSQLDMDTIFSNYNNQS
ncbi:uncharacterized protein LOC122400817 [Colletes gigas]|uniref:uncharacterized protein LOC122400817 n=1 Tax=Colletes gigas TaxID=935657 RepID=UPI001C9A9AA1|nr:uncharacterized protein LOC122400817 [Colletes gigas]